MTSGPPRYSSSAALRTALEEHLRQRASSTGHTWRASLERFDDVLQAAIDMDLGDGFRFEVTPPDR